MALTQPAKEVTLTQPAEEVTLTQAVEEITLLGIPKAHRYFFATNPENIAHVTNS